MSILISTPPIAPILLGQHLQTLGDLFELVAEAVAQGMPNFALEIEARLARRHAWRTVALGRGFAVPHAAVPNLSSSQAIYVRSLRPIPMGAHDGLGVTDALVLLVPRPGLPPHYDLLMNLTAFMTSQIGVAALRSAETAEEIMSAFSQRSM